MDASRWHAPIVHALVIVFSLLAADAFAAQFGGRDDYAGHKAPPPVDPRTETADPVRYGPALLGTTLVSEGPRELVLDVRYRYGGAEGATAKLSATAHDNGRSLPLTSDVVDVGIGEGTVHLTLRRTDNDAASWTSNALRIDLLTDAAAVVTTQEYGVVKTWRSTDAALGVLLRASQPPPPPSDPPACTWNGSDDGTATAPEDRIVARQIAPDGTVELTYGDGRHVRQTEQGPWVFYTDGRPAPLPPQHQHQQAPTMPAPPPSDSPLYAWSENEAENLLGVIRLLVGNDAKQLANYLARESRFARTAFERITARRGAIRYLVQP